MFRMVDLIHKKQTNQQLSKAEIEWMIESYTKNEIPDYQMSAMLMAIYFNGMDEQELTTMTLAMAASGDQYDLSKIEGVNVDKHSTGGVGDTTSLVLAPLVASLGVPVAKMSGRGLGHTGGTLDKLESIEGFNIDLTREEFIEHVNQHHIALVGQTGNLTPADRKIYALRDVTQTVDSIPLIASSIMSKKIASGADAIVLDVKVGAGAFMKNLEDAEQLARTMVKIGNSAGRRTMAVISDMSQPLGNAIGNSLEVKEAIATLKGEGPKDLTELCLILGSQMAYLGGVGQNIEEARVKLEDSITSGKALEKFRDFIKNQGGNPAVVDNPDELLPQTKYKIPFLANREGIISEINAEEIGVAAMLLGAGRETLESKLDYAAGIILHRKIGDKVNKGDVIATIHSNKEDVASSLKKLSDNIIIADKGIAPTLIYEIIEG